jgi:hypothetical protein
MSRVTRIVLLSTFLLLSAVPLVAYRAAPETVEWIVGMILLIFHLNSPSMAFPLITLLGVFGLHVAAVARKPNADRPRQFWRVVFILNSVVSIVLVANAYRIHTMVSAGSRYRGVPAAPRGMSLILLTLLAMVSVIELAGLLKRRSPETREDTTS